MGIWTVIEGYHEASLDELKRQIVPGTQRVPAWGRHEDLGEHFEMLRREFVGSSELLLYHAILVVLIRRKIDLPENVERHRALWEAEADFLLSHLNSKWLVSACDTLAENWADPLQRAFGLAGAMFTKTIKLYETERLATGRTSAAEQYEQAEGRTALHDGSSAFSIGSGHLVIDMHQRVEASLDYGGIGAVRLENYLAAHQNIPRCSSRSKGRIGTSRRVGK
ncbi:MAG: hypothetical protein K2X34_09855 [Hyphomonadaceae bacterium]|nr:hypothetical protein [Hyphomonadaceae bacterium]